MLLHREDKEPTAMWLLGSRSRQSSCCDLMITEAWERLFSTDRQGDRGGRRHDAFAVTGLGQWAPGLRF